MSEKMPVQKLLIQPNQRVRLINPPQNFGEVLAGLPETTSIEDNAATAQASSPADVVILFANHRADLETLLPGVRSAVTSDGKIWVAYHKGTSRVKTDINRDSINDYAKSIGLIGVFIISIDDDWSALRLKIM